MLRRRFSGAIKNNGLYWDYSMGVPDNFGFETVLADGATAKMTEVGYLLTSTKSWKYAWVRSKDTADDNVELEVIFTPIKPTTTLAVVNETANIGSCGKVVAFQSNGKVYNSSVRYEFKRTKVVVRVQGGQYSLTINDVPVVLSPTTVSYRYAARIGTTSDDGRVKSECLLESIKVKWL